MTSRRKCFLFILMIAMISILCAHVTYAAQESSCVKCHTNEAIIKALHKPKSLPPAGSGEG